MKKIILQILATLLFSTTIFAQSEEQKIKLIDEYGICPMEETVARLEQFTIQLGNNPTAKGLIKIYGGQGDSFALPYIRGAIVKAYLKNNTILTAQRFTVLFCNINKQPFNSKFFLIDENEKIEPCEENLTVPQKTVLFQILGFYEDANFSAEKLFEDSKIYSVDPVSNMYSQTVQNVLAKLYKESPESKIYLVGYLGANFFESAKENSKGEYEKKENRNLDKPKMLTKIFREVETALTKNGIDKSGIVKINGGYQDSTKNIEIWF
ncbi:MAG: hypothetical protein ABJA66_19415, partial [Actinomycetota bacterium]